MLRQSIRLSSSTDGESLEVRMSVGKKECQKGCQNVKKNVRMSKRMSECQLKSQNVKKNVKMSICLFLNWCFGQENGGG